MNGSSGTFSNAEGLADCNRQDSSSCGIVSHVHGLGIASVFAHWRRTVQDEHWSEAAAAGGAFVVGVCETLQKFSHPYCHPLYAFVFRPGCAPVEAQELTQGIFAKLLLSG